MMTSQNKHSNKVPKYSKSSNLLNPTGLQRNLSLDDSDDDSMSIEDEKPIRTARRVNTNIFSEELINSMKTFNKL